MQNIYESSNVCCRKLGLEMSSKMVQNVLEQSFAYLLYMARKESCWMCYSYILTYVNILKPFCDSAVM
jgi:hypothetical protein